MSYFKKKDDVVHEHEHARLVLMLMEEINFADFIEDMLLEYPDMSPYRFTELYRAYCGWDNRTKPYLSIETGEPI